jgi:L-rhamnose mutarotase
VTPSKAGYKAAAVVIDTTGAGDSFNGAYLAAIATDGTNAAALQIAHDQARLVVGHKGAIIETTPGPAPMRIGSVIGLRPEDLEEYVKLHADVWPGVLERLKASHFSNYSIYLKEPEMLMFSYFEYTGDDLEADNAAIANDPITQDWWKVCGTMQVPFDTRKDGEWWAEMREVFHLDLDRHDLLAILEATPGKSRPPPSIQNSICWAMFDAKPQRWGTAAKSDNFILGRRSLTENSTNGWFLRRAVTPKS